MGTLSGIEGGRVWQVLFSAVKLPLLLGTTFVLSLPSFFVLNTLVGLRSDFPAVLRALLRSQAALPLVLASLAPYTGLWYLSIPSYPAATLFNGVVFAVATLTAQTLLRRSYRPLVARDRRHRRLLGVWLIVYAFVGIQLGWVLRPFVGDPDKPVQLVREEAWGNAYVIVARLARDAIGP
jgi:hypothetical protein